MRWMAIVPFKGQGSRKTRLAARLDEEQRRRLSESFFAHVVEVLRSCPAICEVGLLSHARPPAWPGPFFQDEGRGLNAELGAAVKSLRPRPLLVIHADLPLLTHEDVTALLAEAEAGCAIAPDREGSGTNAIALRDAAGFNFAFGIGSFARHLLAAEGRARIVRRAGLGLDIDTPDDLDAAIASGISVDPTA